MLKRSSHIRDGMTWKRPKPCFYGVEVFNIGREAITADYRTDMPRMFYDEIAIRPSEYDDGGMISIMLQSALSHSDGGLGLPRHLGRVFIDPAALCLKDLCYKSSHNLLPFAVVFF